MTPSSSETQLIDRHREPFRVLVTLGESTTAGGWSSTRDRCWASVLAALISDFQDRPVTIVNAGIGANVISERVPAYPYSGKPAANERIRKHVIDHNPDLLVISYGLNDARGGTSVQLFCTELTALIRSVRKACDPVIVLLGPYFMTAFSDHPHFDRASLNIFECFNLSTKQVAQQTDCLFCDVLHAYGGSAWMVHDDGVHANDLGHRLIAHRIFETLAQHCSGLAVRTKRLELESERWRDESTLKAEHGY